MSRFRPETPVATDRALSLALLNCHHVTRLVSRSIDLSNAL